MPHPGKRWYHVTIGTYNSWLPGDPRGFRSHDHRIHSSGDHKHPPPAGEHAGLHAHAKTHSGPTVVLPDVLRSTVCGKLVTSLQSRSHRVLIACVGGMHVHLLAELPGDAGEAKIAVGVAKKSASQAVTAQLAGRVWARGCGLKPIRDASHQHNTFRYIERHAEEGAAVWTFRSEQGNGEDEAGG
ncbi:MAG: hypothetical protein AAGA29_03695 [Planctomycetota bacterium]